jgi:putative membrane-bound dehydrogenase-like protein
MVRSAFAFSIATRLLLMIPYPTKHRLWLVCLFVLLLLLARPVGAADGNRFAYLDGDDPYYANRHTARLTTPQWLGEPGVEAVVVLAIDDMRGHQKWEAYLRPILERLKQIDGRAAVSIMTCQIDPNDPHLQTWLKEGLSLECHTFDHPCPLLRRGDFAAAKATYDRCVDLLNQVPGNRPVAFRMPCCDSLNTVSPRFFTEIFARSTPQKHFLTLDSSVFQILTPNDPDVPRALVVSADGSSRFRKYLPFPAFANVIEDYPYPYVIGRACWEFPCIVPSDWEAQNILKPANPQALDDLKRALDAVVAKQGTMSFVFHPYGWIANNQVVDFIDYAERTYGRRVKFLNFREAQTCIDQHLLAGTPIRAADGGDNGVRLLDLDADGFMDVVIANDQTRATRLWQPAERHWRQLDFPTPLVRGAGDARRATGARFGIVDGRPALVVCDENGPLAWRFDQQGWLAAPWLVPGEAVDGEPLLTARAGRDRGVRLGDLDGDGSCELLVANDKQNAVFRWTADDAPNSAGRWRRLAITLPSGARFVDALGRDAGLRLVDVDDDLDLDLLFSDQRQYGLYLLQSLDLGWQKVLAAERPDGDRIPAFVRDGANNGAWFHDRAIWVQNEDTDRLRDLVERRSFNELLAGVEPAPKSPAASLAAMKVADGLRVELVAAEPLVADPIAFDWGPDGALWVVEMADYPDGVEGGPGGRVRRLTDTDGDGRYDQASIFLDRLRYPTSVMSWRRGVLVTASPDLIYAEDTDGDGRADRREPLYTGFAEGNPQHQVNGLVWGLDNWIYGANGDSGGRVRSTKTGQQTPIGGRDFRFRPDDGSFEAIEGYTQFNRNRDDWGNWFGNSNANPMWQYVTSDHYQSRNPHLAAPAGKVDVSDHPGVAAVFPRSRLLERFNDPHTANHFTSACSAIVYRDDLLGGGYAGNAFICEPVHNLIHRELMTRQGLVFKSRRAADEQRGEFLASTDNWFRPTTVRTGPDGALWLADMYRAVIEHTEWIPDSIEAKIDVRAGADLGRIYRVIPVGTKPRPIPNLAERDSQQLVELLESPNGWVRDKVQQLLFERQDRSAVPFLEKMVVGGRRATARLQALCSLDALNAAAPQTLLTALTDAHPGVRRHAVRIAEPLLAESDALRQAVIRLAGDTDPHVRQQVAYSLGECPQEDAGQALGRMALAEAGDPWILAAVMSSAVPHLETIVDTLARDASASEGLAEPVAQLLEIAAATDRQQVIVKLIPVISLKGQRGFAAWQMAALGQLLDVLDRRKSSLVKFRDSASDDLCREIDRLGELFAAARLLAQAPQADLAERQAAIALLGRGLDAQDADIALLTSLLGPEHPDEIRDAAIAALGRLDRDAIPRILLSAWKGLVPQARARVLDMLLKREAWTVALLDALERRGVQQAEIDAARRQQLLAYRSRAVRERAEQLFAGGLDPDRAKIIAQYQAAMPSAGDPLRGAEVFQKHCSVCHRLGDKGHAIGPDLSALTDKSPEAITIAVLDPNRAIESKFISYLAVTNTGLSYTGLLAAETGNSLTLLGQENKQQVILRTELEALESTGKSLMPEGLEKDLSPGDLADCIAYLRASGSKPKELPGNRPEIVRPEALRGYLFCLGSNAEIYGDSLRLEETNGNLGWWTAQNDHAVWTIEVPREMVYAVVFDAACDEASAGNQWILECAGQRISGTVASTGDWNTYKRGKVGELRLKPGQHRLGIRAGGPLRGALFDLRSVTLLPYGRLVK